jgi:ribonuclease P protein component
MVSLSAHKPRWSGYPRCLAIHPRFEIIRLRIEEIAPNCTASQELPFALQPPRHLYSSFVLTLSTESGAAIFHAQAYIPTQPAQAKQEAWFSHAHEDPGRQKGDFPPPRQGTEAGFREARLPRVAFPVPLTSTVESLSRLPLHTGMLADAALRSCRIKARPDFAMPQKKAARFPRSARLLRHADFERVYKQGRRHFSASFTVFYWPRPQAQTPVAGSGPASPHSGLRIGFTVGRALGGAVQRNRMKRRLREAVRICFPQSAIAADVVINPKKSLLTTDFAAVRSEVTRAFGAIEQKLSKKVEPETVTKRIAEARSPRPESRS